MNRGMITLTDQELALAQAVLQAEASNTLLLQRLEAGSNTGAKSVSIECSEEDLEVLLDVLPPPHQQTDVVATTLRPKVQNTLLAMRSPKSSAKVSLWSKLNPAHWFAKK